MLNELNEVEVRFGRRVAGSEKDIRTGLLLNL